MAKAILTFQTAAKAAMAAGAQLEDITGVPSRSALMRGKFEASYVDDIEEMVATMVKESKQPWRTTEGGIIMAGKDTEQSQT